MSKTAKALAIGASVLALLGGGTIWQLAFRVPAVDPSTLPERLVALTTADGQRLLAESSASADYPPLVRNFESQRRPAYCGVASSVAVLNALRASGPRLTQGSFFADWPTELRVTFTGMTLQELGALLRQHAVEVEIGFASGANLDTFRAIARENLGRSGDYLMINYDRAALGQRGGGHISPLAAYDAATDRFLILDVAAYRYPPTWVPAADLWNAMNTVDTTSGQTRGYAVIRQPR